MPQCSIGSSVSWLSAGWSVVMACGVIAACSWGLGFYGLGVYLETLHRLHGWPTSLISAAIALYYLVGALGLLIVGGIIERRRPAPVMVYGALTMGAAVAALGWLREPWQLFAVLAAMGTGCAGLSTTLALPFGLGLIAQVGFLVHQLARLEPTLGPLRAALAVSATTVSALVGRVAAGWLSDRMDRRGSRPASPSVWAWAT